MSDDSFIFHDESFKKMTTEKESLTDDMKIGNTTTQD